MKTLPQLFSAAMLLAALTAHGQGKPQVPTLFLVGDLKTAAVQGASDEQTLHLRESSGAGETARAYLNSGAWNAVLAQMHPGDFVLIDFSQVNLPAHDQSDAVRTLDGFGDGTFDYLTPGTGTLELVHSFGWYLRRMVVDVINHGGVPLLCAGPADPAHPGASDWARYIATEERITLVPLRADRSGLLAGLRSLPADPLAPYLRGDTGK